GPLAEGRQPLRREAVDRPRVRRPVDPGVGHGEAPRLEDRVPADGARRPAEDLCPRIVIQTREGHAAEVAKGPLVAVEEHREPLVRIAIRETAARVAEGEHEEVDGLRPLADPHPQLPEVDLRLLAGAGLEADGRDGRPAALVPPRLHVPLHLEVAAAEAERPELPVQDRGIPADLRAAPRDELAKRLELLASPPALRAPAPQVPPALHGLLVHAQLAGDPLHPLAPLEPGQDLPHHVLLHHRPLRRSRWDRRRRYGKRLLLHTVPSSLGGGGNFRRRLRGEFYATDDNGNLCNGVEVCHAGVCQPGTPVSCADNNPCTTETCDPKAGCLRTAVANGTPCIDSNLCNGEETCQSGVCSPGTPPICSGSGIDACDPITGCTQDIMIAAHKLGLRMSFSTARMKLSLLGGTFSMSDPPSNGTASDPVL